ncbi:MAG: hypothetical protein MK066_03900 [Crocinitomicaceae bacterium]|nr:hypothetical protein [Crocinitomicaceae bacterium]
MKKYLFYCLIGFLSVGCNEEKQNSSKNEKKVTKEEKKEIKPVFSDGKINGFEIGEYSFELPQTSKVYSSSGTDFSNFYVEDAVHGNFGLYFGFFPSYP